MKRRLLKKNVNQLVQELTAECLWAAKCQKMNPDDIDNLVRVLMTAHSEAIARISHSDKHQAKLHFKKMRATFIASMSEVAEQLFNLA